MIIETLPNTNPYNYQSGNACKILGPSLPTPVDEPIAEFCICDFIQCTFSEKVLQTLQVQMISGRMIKANFYLKGLLQ